MLTASIVLVLLALVAVFGIYNPLVRDRNRVHAAWSDIDVQLRRRHDLVPQLVTTVKAYADYEKATLAAVTELRARSEAAQRLADKAALEKDLAAGVTRLLVVAEAYPDLKANANFARLQAELVEIEDHIQYARRFYNGAVRNLNTRIETFPHMLLARPLGFQRAEYFEVEDAEQRAAPRLELEP